LVQHVMMEETTNLMKPSTFASCILHKAFNEIGWCITNDWSDVTIIFRHANCKFANFGIDFAHKCICYTFHCQNHFHCCAPLSTTHHHPKTSSMPMAPYGTFQYELTPKKPKAFHASKSEFTFDIYLLSLVFR
jgi:hypothetical protein